jgi:hypothetical protein
MNNAVAEPDIHDRLIWEAFIDPIRTVIVVDDEYPTLDSLTDKEAGEMKNWSKKKQENIPTVREILAFARDKQRSWLIDVHDAKDVTPEVELAAAAHLHHSDLLVLDYHLQGDDGGGDVAIAILRALAGGDHFNLVIVHTKGYDGGIDKVIREIALSLTCIDSSLILPEEEAVKAALSKWEEHDEEIISKLEAEISEDTYLELRTKFPGNYQDLLKLPAGQRILDIWKGRPRGIDIKPNKLVIWLLTKKQGELEKQFSGIKLGNVMVGNTDEINWIKTEKLFVTVLSKDYKPEHFETKLMEAIKASFPSPHRLLLTKMRTEIEKRGLSAEAEILGDRYMQAEWLNEFLNPDPIDPKAVTHNTINRHWEALGDRLRLALDGYANCLHEHFSALGRGAVLAGCGINKSDIGSEEALKRFNCFSSTKPIDRAHLTTGHVFRMENGVGGEHQYWICLSPACDMVPGQGNDLVGSDNLPFVAVRLYPVSDGQALRNATKNIFLFLNIDEDVCAFSIHKDGISQNPDWGQMYARNQGKFHDTNKLSIGSIIKTQEDISLSWSEASVLTQLRSEYALNLLQRIGAVLSRPGLGMNFKKRGVVG